MIVCDLSTASRRAYGLRILPARRRQIEDTGSGSNFARQELSECGERRLPVFCSFSCFDSTSCYVFRSRSIASLVCSKTLKSLSAWITKGNELNGKDTFGMSLRFNCLPFVCHACWSQSADCGPIIVGIFVNCRVSLLAVLLIRLAPCS
jgi:hypothetical protein